MPPVHVTAAIIHRAGQVLIARRATGELAGSWEFPGGKVEPGESLESCLVREIREELSLEIVVEKPYLRVGWTYPAKEIALHSFVCRWVSGEGLPDQQGHDRTAWVPVDVLPDYEFAPADRPIVARLLEEGLDGNAAPAGS